MIRYLIPSTAAVVLLIAAAVLQGHFTERWHQRPVTEVQKAFADRLAKAPTTIGDWESEEIPISDRELEASRSVGSFSRVFHNRNQPGKVVHMFVVCGHPRDITQHTPDQCYVLNGFTEVDEERKFLIDVGDGVASFWTNRFRKGATYEGPQHLRIFWSFSANGEWVSPTIARVELANAPALYKAYAITEVSGDAAERPEESAAKEFLGDFLPALNAALFPPEPGEAAPIPGEKLIGQQGARAAAAGKRAAQSAPQPGEK